MSHFAAPITAAGTLVLLLVLPAAASTKTVNIGDNAVFWLHDGQPLADADNDGYTDAAPSIWQEDNTGQFYQSDNPKKYSQQWKNLTDTIGGPDFADADITDFDLGLNQIQYDGTSGELLRVIFRYTETPLALTLPGDLLIDVGDDQTWDYVIRTPFTDGTDVRGATLGKVGYDQQEWDVYSGSWDYSVNADVSQYELARESYRADGNPWEHRYVIREDHPWRLRDSAVDPAAYGDQAYVGQAGFDGWKLALGPDELGTSTFILDGLDLPIDLREDAVRFGFTVNCANDVVYEALPVDLLPMDLVPEPTAGTVWCLLAMTGLTLARRRRVQCQP